MADTARLRTRPTTLDEFLAWEESQSDKHEFRNGQIRMMTGGTLRHTLVSGNIFATLRERLKGSPCRVYAADARVALREVDAGYYPDVVVDCGPYDGGALAAIRPTVVFEVLSPGTRSSDFSEKVPDYRDTESIVQIVLVEPDERKVYSWINANGGWRQYEISEGDLPLPSLGFSLAFDDIYEGA